MCGQANLGTAEISSLNIQQQDSFVKNFFAKSIVFFSKLLYPIFKGDDRMKRMVTMQDLSCLGKCSLTVIQPTVSAMGVECAVLPTALLSTHTAFPAPAVTDLSRCVRPILDHWETIGAKFDAILTGYLANEAQGALALELMDRFGQDALIVADPAMGDHGRLYSGIAPEMVEVHRKICARADLILPNLTEGALLAGVGYEDRSDLGFCQQIATELLKTSAKAVLLTGYSPEPGKVGFYYRDAHTEFAHAGPRHPRSCHGTGDLFAAIVTGGLVRGMAPSQAGVLAAEFIHRSIAKTGENSRFGVEFEGELGWLSQKVLRSEC
jgi:pyridoxine kinase